jgi:hypothetical protein
MVTQDWAQYAGATSREARGIFEIHSGCQFGKRASQACKTGNSWIREILHPFGQPLCQLFHSRVAVRSQFLVRSDSGLKAFCAVFQGTSHGLLITEPMLNYLVPHPFIGGIKFG